MYNGALFKLISNIELLIISFYVSISIFLARIYKKRERLGANMRLIIICMYYYNIISKKTLVTSEENIIIISDKSIYHKNYVIFNII